jgi:hypothetical protein
MLADGLADLSAAVPADVLVLVDHTATVSAALSAVETTDQSAVKLSAVATTELSAVVQVTF